MPLALGLLFLAGWSSAATRYDPHLRFRVIRTPHFSVLFHQGEDELATRLAAIAEEVHARLSQQLDVPANRHTRVILVDQNDDANGWATPMPFDTVEISAAAPAPSSSIGYTDDWLRLVFTHEYTHILHLDESRGLFAGLRYVFGRAPVLFPNMFLPGWETEGLATFYETRDTGLGRLRSGEFRLIVDAAARAGRVDPIDRASGALVDWPGGNAAYAYGARFHEYLAARFGPDAFSRLAAATAGRVPYFPGGAYKKVFGASARELWKGFAASQMEPSGGSDRPNEPANPSGGMGTGSIVRLTHQGFITAGPRWLPDGRVLYTSRTPHEFPALKATAGDGHSRTLAHRYLGERSSISNGRVFFDQQELVRNVGLQSDLYVLSLADGRVQRLTRQARAADPDASPDGRTLVHTTQAQDRSSLVLRDIDITGRNVRVGDARPLREEAGTQYAAPRWSPDGRHIAAERRRPGRRPEVVVIDVTSRAVVGTISVAEGRVGEPEWLGVPGRLVVSLERPSAPFSLYEVDLNDGPTARAFIDLPNGSRSAAVSANGDRVAFVGYTTDGYDIFTAPVHPAEPAEPGRLQVQSGDSDSQASGVRAPGNGFPASSAPYSPLGTLLPRFWMPVAETDEDRLELGAGTAGIDALGRHAYSSTVRWSDRARPDWDVSYAYDRWRPTVFVSAADDLTVWQGADYRETSIESGLVVPFNTIRRGQLLYGSVHATREEDPSGVFDRNAIRFAYQVSTSRRYGYSISPQDGVLGGATLEITRKAFGSDADAQTFTADVRAYPRLGGQHRILSLRAAFAGSYGDLEGRRVIGAGGTAAPGSTIAFGRDAIGLARGFATDDIVGYRAAVVNVDYRVPFWNVERGIGSLPIFFRQVHGALFADAAHAWRSTFRMADVRTSVGLELSSDVVLGHYLPLTITGGVAFRRDPAHVQEGAMGFWRIGYAF
ncbi:MAG: BamA/TamA family outer membrane protein [Acidobacteriota bacterium]